MNFACKLLLGQVRDEEGRRRFHGAFTGGFSAGYYNTVGTKEGWAPSTFKSSRGNRASAVQQRPEDFMDDEDDALLGRQLQARSQFDTFGVAGKQAAREASDDTLGLLFREHEPRAPAIPGPVIDDLIVPSSQPIGKQLLAAMGWREGTGVGPRSKRKAIGGAAAADGDDDDDSHDPYAAGHTFAPKNAEVFKIIPKNDRFGLGFDPLKDAPEFRKPTASSSRPDADGGPGAAKPHVVTIGHALISGKSGGGFSAGVFDDEELGHMGDDDELYSGGDRSGYHRVLAGDDDDDTGYEGLGKGRKGGDGLRGGRDSRSGGAGVSKDSVGGGFVRATGSGSQVLDKVYNLPPVPKDYRPVHVFSEAEEAEFRSLRSLITGQPIAAPALNATAGPANGSRPPPPITMNAQSRAVLLGEKPVIGTRADTGGVVAPPAAAAPNAAALEAILGESRFVSSSAPSSMYVGSHATSGGLMSKQEFEAK